VAGRRDQIQLSSEEVARFLEGERVMNVCTNGRDGWPHVTALWYVLRDGEPWIYTYAKSQKVRNLERDARATLLVESGHEYHELKGVMLKTRAEIHSDLDTVAALAEQLMQRYRSGSDGQIDEATREGLRAQARKRVAIHFHVEQTASWDHSKLAGSY
jgi:PPOX class probable F420-dependent enzyme